MDINNPKEVEEFRKDLRFGGDMRRRADKGVMALIGAIFALLGSALCWGVIAIIKTKFGEGP